MKTFYKISTIAALGLVFVFLLSLTMEKVLKENRWICTPEKDYNYRTISNKKFKIKDPLIIAFNFKEESYTKFPDKVHLFPKIRFKGEISNPANSSFGFKSFDNNEILKATDCFNNFPTGISSLEVENDKNQKYYISLFDFRKLKIEIVN